MRILVVAMLWSVHTARWLRQIADMGWEIHLFPSQDYGHTHPELKNVIVHRSKFWKQRITEKQPHILVQSCYKAWAFLRRKIVIILIPNYRERQLAYLIKKIRPDIIHSMESQSAGYLVSAVRKQNPHFYPKWVHTLWGSDIYLYGRLISHKTKITQLLTHIDYLICEGERDVALSRTLGFSGQDPLVLQATGGFDISFCSSLRLTTVKTSERPLIMLKGYQSWAGRSLFGLRALERCADILSGYTVAIYSANSDVDLATELFSESTGIPVQIIPYVSHDEMLKFHGKARVSISLSISDGIPNSMLEAMAMGSFPIQSWTASTDGWIEDGINGILVPPEDPEVIEIAIRKALLNDELVNSAALYNWALIKDRLDEKIDIGFHLSEPPREQRHGRVGWRNPPSRPVWASRF